MSADLDEFALAKLAQEMVRNIRPYQKVFADFGIDENDFYEIEKNEFYKKIKEQFAVQWNATTSVADRVKLQAATGYEVLLPIVGKRMLRPDEPLASVIEGAKLFMKTAGIGEAKSESNTAERFVITINLGADTEGKPMIEHYDKSVAIDANDISPDPKSAALKSLMALGEKNG